MRAHFWGVPVSSTIVAASHPAKQEEEVKFQKVTPNLVVSSISASLKFYERAVGLQRQMTVPEQEPFVFAGVGAGNVEIFLNQREAAAAEYPAFASKPLGGTFTMYIEVDDVEELYRRVQASKAKIVMPMEKKFYGMQEFAVADPDGYLITFAQRVAG
ncbi:MAG: VOC family protein [Acidobacteriales bacterium]|nr:VOC family protein [Terriglobales bacterium]